MLHNSQNVAKILDLTCDTLFMLTNEGVFVDVVIKTNNPYINESKELIGKNIFNIFPSVTLREFKPEFEQHLATGEVSNKNYDLPFEDEMFYFKCIMHKFDENHVLCQYRDITQRSQMKKRLNSANITLREVERAAKIGHWSYDCDSRTFQYKGFVNGAYMILEENPVLIQIDNYISKMHPDDISTFISFFEQKEMNSVIAFRLIQNEELAYLCGKIINKRYDGDKLILEGYTQNITEIVHEKQEMEMVLSAVNNSSEYVFAVKLDGTMVFANKKCRLINKIDSQFDISNRKVYDVLADFSNMGSWDRFIKKIKNNNGLYHYVNKHSCPDFDIVACDSTSCIIKNGLGEDVIWTFMRDISSHIRYEEGLKKAKEVAEESDRLKTAFVSNMSHEIRTPLNAIVGFSDVIAQTDDANQRIEFSKIIKSNSTQLLTLVKEVLDLSRMETENFKLLHEPVSLVSVCDEQETIHALGTSNVKAVFDAPDVDFVLNSDRQRLSQVLSNLIINALKFTEQGYVHFGYSLKDNFVEFYVKDTGIGIQEKYLNQIFNRFMKIDSFDKGSGLGLAICKTLVEKMGGEISVESVVNQGSIFRFTIPIKSEK